MSQYKILSIDGGGIRGVIPAMVLAEIESRTDRRIAELFDFCAGTSTGGILALGLNVPDPYASGMPRFSASELVSLYEMEGGEIFSTAFGGFVSSFLNVFDEKYDEKGIETVLEKYFGDTRLSQAVKDVMVTSYAIETRRPFFFKSTKAKQDPQRDFMMTKAARATSAAPTYFEPLKLESRDEMSYYSLIDGGVFANNPAMCALSEAVRDGQQDIFVFSVGTGLSERPYKHENAKDWGLAKWIRPLIDIMMDGNSDTVHYQMEQFFGVKKTRNYYRLQAYLPDGTEIMDNTDPENLRALKLVADRLISQNSAKIDEICHRLT